MRFVVCLHSFVSVLSLAMAACTRKCEVYEPSSGPAASTGLQQQFADKVSSQKLVEVFFSYASRGLWAPYSPTFYQPWRWEVVPGSNGRTLMTLRPNYDIMSLWTLRTAVGGVGVDIEDEPRGCLPNVASEDLLYLLRNFLLNGLRETPLGEHSNVSGIEALVCSMAVLDDGGTAKFLPSCYEKKEETTCCYLEENPWMAMLHLFIIFVKVATVLYCPLFFPERLLKNAFRPVEYVHNRKESLELRLKISRKSNSKLAIPLRDFSKWKSFRGKLAGLQMDQPYSFRVRACHFQVDSRRLIPKCFVPISLFRLLYDQVFRCKLRNVSAFSDCCRSRIAGKLGDGRYTWFTCCRGFAKILALLLVPIPWIIRLVIYYTYEEKVFYERQRAARDRRIEEEFWGNILVYFTPIHWMFLVMYCVLFVDFLFFGVLAKHVTEKFVFVIKCCLRDTRQSSKTDACSWAMFTILCPFQRFGLFGIFIAAIYWPLVLPVIFVVLAFYFLPTVNLTLRLLLHITWYCIPQTVISSKKGSCAYLKKGWKRISEEMQIHKLKKENGPIGESEKNRPAKERSVQIVIVILSLLSLNSMVVILMEILGFLVELGTFTIMGLIVNADILLRFVSLAFVILVYIFDSIKSVRCKYLKFHKKIVETIIDRAKSDILEAEVNSQAQDNKRTAFSIRGRRERSQSGQVSFDAKRPKYQMQSLILFFDLYDQPFLPVKFFHSVCMLPINGCPGPAYKNYLKAFTQLLFILLFVLFVFMVVMAFGEIYHISSTNQMLATIAGGFLPWMLTNCLLSKAEENELDTTTVSFQRYFGDAIDNYSQKWPLTDLEGSVEGPLNSSSLTMNEEWTDKIENSLTLSDNALEPFMGGLHEVTDDMYLVLIPSRDSSMSGSVSMLTNITSL